jgi:hypothetical protein
MSQRRANDTECTCPGRPAPREITTTYEVNDETKSYSYIKHPNRCAADCCKDEHAMPHHFGCPLWGPTGDTYVPGLTRTTKSFLGSPRTPYLKWVRALTMYSWPLWRNWTPPKPIKVETGAEVLRRQLRAKPHIPWAGDKRL